MLAEHNANKQPWLQILRLAVAAFVILSASEVFGLSLRAGNYPEHQTSIVGSARGIPNRLFYKKSEPQWEDLGWAWGKRSDKEFNGAEPHLITTRSDSPGAISYRAFQNKNAPDWQDLGWAWGRKR